MEKFFFIRIIFLFLQILLNYPAQSVVRLVHIHLKFSFGGYVNMRLDKFNVEVQFIHE